MEKLYTIKEVMEKFKVSRSTIHRLMVAGKLSRIKIGGNIRIKESELIRIIEER